jgi:hypothetical protein
LLTLDLRQPTTPQLESFPEDAFRSLAMAVRQAYMLSEVANFDHVSRILERATDADAKEFVSTLRHNWKFALVSPPGLGIEGRTYSGREVFHTWLYAHAVHQDPRRREDAERLDRMDPLPTWVVQVIVRSLAICILQLDVAAADALGEDALPGFATDVAQDRRFRF